MATKGGGVKNLGKSGYVIYGRPPSSSSRSSCGPPIDQKTVLTFQNESHTNLKSLGLALKTNPTKKSKKKWPPISCQGERVRTNIAQDLDGAETQLANN